MSDYLPDSGDDLTTSDIRDLLDVDDDDVPTQRTEILQALVFVLIEMDALTGPSDLAKRDALQELIGTISGAEQLFDHTLTVTYDREEIETTVTSPLQARSDTVPPGNSPQMNEALLADEDELVAALEAVTEELLAGDQSPPVKARPDINDGYQRYLAEAVYKRLDEPANVDVLQIPVGMGDRHVCLKHDDRYYDAEAPDGVGEPGDLPIFDGRLVAPDEDLEPIVVSGTYVALSEDLQTDLDEGPSDSEASN